MVQSGHLGQNAASIGAGGHRQIGQRQAPQRSHHLRDARQLGRAVATLGLAQRPLFGGLVKPLRRDVGRIGLQHQGAQGQLAGQAAQLQRALVGQAAAKAERKTQVHKG